MRGEAATESEEQELQRAKQGASRILYEDDKVSDAILNMVQEENVVGTGARAVVTLVTELDKKMDLDPVVIAPLTAWASDKIIDLVEHQRGKEFSDEQAQQMTMTAWEGVLKAYGVDEEGMGQLVEGMPDEEFGELQGMYGQMLGPAETAAATTPAASPAAPAAVEQTAQQVAPGGP